MHKKIIVIFIFIVTGLSVNQTFAQKTVITDPPHRTYQEALTLFDQKNYPAAQALFSQYMRESKSPTNVFYENAAYYNTVCAVHLDNKSALNDVRKFAGEYPESAWLPSINFELGKLYYKNRKYREALKAFQEISPNMLSKEQRPEYYYKRGFSELKLDRLDPALANFTKVKGQKSAYTQPAIFYSAHINYRKENYQEALDGFKSIENSRRFSKYIPNYLIHIYYELGDYQKVIDEGTVYLNKASNKNKGVIGQLIANSYYDLGNYPKASEYFKVYERFTVKKISQEENYRIGYCKYLAGEYKSAISNFQEASRNNEKLAQDAWYYLGFCYLGTGESNFAQSSFIKAYRLGNDKTVSTDGLYNYVKVTLELGGDPYNDPVQIVEEWINKNQTAPRINEAYDLLAQLYLTSKNYRGALESIENTQSPNIKLKEIYQQIAYTQGIDYFNRGAYPDAIGYFEKSLRYTPDKDFEARSVFWIADAFYRMKKFRDASGMFKRFLNLPASGESDLYAMGLYNYAYANFNLKQYSIASDYFGRFLQQNNQNPNYLSDARLRLADSYFISTNYVQASKEYDKVIAGNTSNTDYALYQKAFCYGAQGAFDKKVSTLRTMIGKYRTSTLYDDALFELASTSLILNDPRSAIIYFDKLAKEKPNSPFAKKALIKMGFVYYNNNQNDRAIETLKQVIDKYPASLEAREALNTLQNIYMDEGKVDEYFVYAKGLDFVQVSTSEEDSLTFVSGENHFINNDCDKAIPALERYVQQFPNGGFVLSSYYYLSKCYENQQKQEQAIGYYMKIIDFPDNQYTAEALLKVAGIEFEKQDFNEAFTLYQRLMTVAENKGMILEATDGAMRCAYNTSNYGQAEDYANQLLNTKQVTDNQAVFAQYIIAKSSLEMRNIGKAENAFVITDELTSGELGAEAKYQLALINFQKNHLDESENLIYQLPEQYADYDYWIAKGFILLADIYVARDDNFQAGQTLQSVIDNYLGEDLREIARQKLNTIQPADVPSDSIN